MPLHVFSAINLEMNKWNQQSMLWRNTKECVVSENSCSKIFVNFQEKHPHEIAFLNKVAGYLTFTENVHLGNLGNFQNSFHKKHPRMPASAISCHWKMFRPKMFFKKCPIRFFSFTFWYSMACAPRGMKCITDVQELNIWIRCIVIF